MERQVYGQTHVDVDTETERRYPTTGASHLYRIYGPWLLCSIDNVELGTSKGMKTG